MRHSIEQRARDRVKTLRQLVISTTERIYKPSENPNLADNWRSVIVGDASLREFWGYDNLPSDIAGWLDTIGMLQELLGLVEMQGKLIQESNLLGVTPIQVPAAKEQRGMATLALESASLIVDRLQKIQTLLTEE